MSGLPAQVADDLSNIALNGRLTLQGVKVAEDFLTSRWREALVCNVCLLVSGQSAAKLRVHGWSTRVRIEFDSDPRDVAHVQICPSTHSGIDVKAPNASVFHHGLCEVLPV